MTLIPFSARGIRAHWTLPGSSGVQLAHATDFVSSAGRAGILTACYAAVLCHFHETLSVGGQVIGRRRASLGAGELDYVEVQLNQAGQKMLGQSKGNRLTVRVALSDGTRTRMGQVGLVRYS